VDLESKAPQEATFDNDEEDVVFGGPSKKGKNVGKGAQKQQQSKDEDEDEEDGTGRVKTKKEKEKEKKEREKQRKKEQVCAFVLRFLFIVGVVC
jgi:translation initiation factor 5B